MLSSRAVRIVSQSSGTVFIRSVATFNGTVQDFGRIERHHHTEAPFGNHPHRRCSKAESQKPVKGGRPAAALKVAENDRPGLFAGPFGDLARDRSAIPPSRTSRPAPWSLLTISPSRGVAPSAATTIEKCLP